MQRKTILNRVQEVKSFVYARVRRAGGGDACEREVEVAKQATDRGRGSGIKGSEYLKFPGGFRARI